MHRTKNNLGLTKKEPLIIRVMLRAQTIYLQSRLHLYPHLQGSLCLGKNFYSFIAKFLTEFHGD
jgi:hypothetical protein